MTIVMALVGLNVLSRRASNDECLYFLLGFLFICRFIFLLNSRVCVCVVISCFASRQVIYIMLFSQFDFHFEASDVNCERDLHIGYAMCCSSDEFE